MTNFLTVTELPEDEVTYEQVERLCNRYYWAGKYCINKDVLEVACGPGLGLGYLKKLAKSVSAGDCCFDLIKIAREYYGDQISIQQFDAQDIPYPDKSMDIVIIFEAIYYLTSVDKFITECRRILRSKGKILLVTANKDLYDFNPSPYSNRYYGVVELNELFTKHDFLVDFFGVTPINNLPLRQRILRPVKRLAVTLSLIPKTMKGKKFFKKVVFGKLIKMPGEIKEGMMPYLEPTRLPTLRPDNNHKVIYCVATVK